MNTTVPPPDCNYKLLIANSDRNCTAATARGFQAATFNIVYILWLQKFPDKKNQIIGRIAASYHPPKAWSLGMKPSILCLTV
jgi:hypothetical protein